MRKQEASRPLDVKESADEYKQRLRKTALGLTHAALLGPHAVPAVQRQTARRARVSSRSVQNISRRHPAIMLGRSPARVRRPGQAGFARARAVQSARGHASA